MKKQKKLPYGYWSKAGVPSHNLLRLWMIFEHLYPRFKRRSETMSRQIVNDVLDAYLKVSPIENQMPDYDAVWFQLSYAYASYTTPAEGYTDKYKLYDNMVVKYMI